MKITYIYELKPDCLETYYNLSPGWFEIVAERIGSDPGRAGCQAQAKGAIYKGVPHRATR